jgi:hypothetical protein
MTSIVMLMRTLCTHQALEKSVCKRGFLMNIMPVINRIGMCVAISISLPVQDELDDAVL